MAESAADKAVEVAQEMVPVLDKWLQELLDWTREGADFASEQLPLLVEDIIQWGMVAHFVWAAVFFIPVICMSALVRCAWRFAHTKDADFTDGATAVSFSIIGLVLSGVLFMYNLLAGLKAFIAPRLYLIEFLKDMV